MTSILPFGKQTFTAANGTPLALGTVAYYVPSTTTPKTTWQDAGGTTPNANPVVLDAYGQAIIWGSGSYRQVVKDAAGNTIWDQVVSENSTYTPPGSGAVVRSLTSKAADWLSAADYGVTGDGITDDRAALAAAVAEGGVLGKPVLMVGLTGNTFRVASALTLSGSILFLAGGNLKPDTGVTIAITGNLTAPSTRIFSGLGVVTLSLGYGTDAQANWWGAIPDGATDNTAVVNAAIVALGAGGGGRLRFGSGSYNFSGTVTLNQNNVSLVGANPGATYLNFANGSSDCIKVGTVYTTPYYDNIIESLTILGTSKTGGYGINLRSAANTVIRNVVFSNLPGGLYCQFINNVTLEDSIILIQNASGYTAAVYWYSPANAAETSNVLALFNVVINCNGTGANGIYVDGSCQTLRIQNTGVIHAYFGLYVRNTAASNQYYPQFIFCNDLEIDGVQQSCMRIDGGRYMRFVNCDFFNNYSGGGTDSDVVFINPDGSASVVTELSFTTCRIAGAQHNGFVCAAKNVQITGCYIGDNSLASSGTYQGVSLFSTGGTNGAASSITICGGQIGAVFGDVGNQGYGVYVGTGVSRVTITGVDFSNCVTTAIGDGTGGLGNVQWSGCIDITGAELANRMPILPGDPSSPVEGMIWENASSHTLRVYLNSTVKTITAV